MHSLKNTIVAVGLLGLSFWFYQASTKTGPDLSDQIPPLEVSDGMEEPAQLSIDGSAQANIGFGNENSGLGTFPSLQKNNSSQQAGAEFSASLAKNANDFADAMKNSIPLNSTTRQNSIPAPGTSDQANQNFVRQNNTAPVSNPPSNNSARDQGLIAALDSQAQWQKNRQVDSEKNKAAAVYNGEFQFDSQPIPSGDSSYNRLANDSRTTDSGSAVAQASIEPSGDRLTFQAAWPQVDKLVAAEDYRGALQLLSPFYRKTNLTGPQRQRLMAWLDALAGKVIFSDEHHLEKMPYTVANESLTDIAQRWNVPAQLIYNINKAKIQNSTNIAAGTELKIVKGPFHGEVSLSGKVMTLFLNGLYAGRYPVEVGISGNPKPGEYRVLVKAAGGHAWRDAEGNEFPPGAPQNGYGPNWIGLSGFLCIHQIPEDMGEGHSGCIGLNAKDSKDVFGILSEASNVTLLR